MKNLKQFFEYSIERQKILLRRQEGKEAPWTEDKVIQEFRFCNIFREDDRTTTWFRENIRDPLKGNDHVFLATVAFRWLNKIESGMEMLPDILTGWSREKIERRLCALRKHDVAVFTGAYIIRGPDGKRKLEGIFDCVDQVAAGLPEFFEMVKKKKPTLQSTHEWLQQFPYMGPFMAYEVVTDLRHTHILNKAKDINTWASAGPGCARGLGWLAFDNPGQYTYGSKTANREMMSLMLELLQHSKDEWPREWQEWEMREVEHTLCEYDKWRRGHEGQRLKRRYG